MGGLMTENNEERPIVFIDARVKYTSGKLPDNLKEMVEFAMNRSLINEADVVTFTVIFAMLSVTGAHWEDAIKRYLWNMPAAFANMKRDAKQWPEEYRKIFEEFTKDIELPPGWPIESED
jgi:hypothetical protein